jgi:hypothetical protein
MIIYDGLITRGSSHFIVFKNDRDARIEVPIDERSYKVLSVYLNKISAEAVDCHMGRNNTEDSE